GIPVDTIRVVPEPIDLDLWTPLLAGAPRCMPAGFTVLCVARMYPRKSLGTLLTAMARLRVAHPQARLRLVGHGPEEQHLRRLAARLGLDDAVTFLVLNQAAFFDLWFVGGGWIRCGSRSQPKAAQTRSASSGADSSRAGSATRFFPANHLGSIGLSQGLLVGR